jgi:hypothetical protein
MRNLEFRLKFSLRAQPKTSLREINLVRSTMAASAVFIMDHRGKILISRNYRGDVPMSVASRFISKVLEEEEVSVKPIVEEDGVTYIFVKHHNLFCILVK